MNDYQENTEVYLKCDNIINMGYFEDSPYNYKNNEN